MDFKTLAEDLLLEKEKLLEKLIHFNQGANYGQVVWMAGGIASGKSFALKNFINSKKYRRVDPDRFKVLYQKLQKATGNYPEIKGLDRSNPEDATKLHKFIKKQGVRSSFIQNLITGNFEGRLPNILFDSHVDSIGKLTKYLPLLKNVGYESQNLHLLWILTDYEVALNRNQDRDRVAPEDVVLKSHRGNAKTMLKFFKNGLPKTVDGSVYVILNNPEHTVFFRDEPAEAKSVKPNKLPRSIYRKAQDVDKDDEDDYFIIDDFKSLKLKESGESFRSSKSIKKELYMWIKDNAPKTSNLYKLMRKSNKS